MHLSWRHAQWSTFTPPSMLIWQLPGSCVCTTHTLLQTQSLSSAVYAQFLILITSLPDPDRLHMRCANGQVRTLQTSSTANLLMAASLHLHQQPHSHSVRQLFLSTRSTKLAKTLSFSMVSTFFPPSGSTPRSFLTTTMPKAEITTPASVTSAKSVWNCSSQCSTQTHMYWESMNTPDS